MDQGQGQAQAQGFSLHPPISPCISLQENELREKIREILVEHSDHIAKQAREIWGDAGRYRGDTG